MHSYRVTYKCTTTKRAWYVMTIFHLNQINIHNNGVLLYLSTEYLECILVPCGNKAVRCTNVLWKTLGLLMILNSLEHAVAISLYSILFFTAIFIFSFNKINDPTSMLWL